MDEREAQLRENVLLAVQRYWAHCDAKTPYRIGDYIPYAGRIYDGEELCALTEAALDFWLTAGPWTERFEGGLADYLGVERSAMSTEIGKLKKDGLLDTKCSWFSLHLAEESP